MMDNIFVTRSSMPPYEEYIEAIKPLWESHWLTNMGVYHKELEAKLAEYLKVSELSLMVNGHMALEMTIQSFGFSPGSEVITTPFTFISTTHAIVRNNLQPVFCDISEKDGTIDTTKIEKLVTSRTVAILPVHVYGNVCDVDAIDRIARKYNLKVIYDAAHAFGVSYRGNGIGNYGDASIFSFHATKVFNTIEGGAVVCKSHDLYERLKDLKNFGIRNEELVASVGANAKMNEFSAIMGLCNLRHVQEVISARKKVSEYYDKQLESIRGIDHFTQRKGIIKNYGYYPIILRNMDVRDGLTSCLLLNNIHARKYFWPLTADQACFKNKYKDINIEKARALSERVLVLPLFEGMDEKTVDYICKIIRDYLKEMG